MTLKLARTDGENDEFGKSRISLSYYQNRTGCCDPIGFLSNRQIEYSLSDCQRAIEDVNVQRNSF